MSRRKVEQKVSRKSPRLCALDAWRKAQHQLVASPQSKARKKRKLKPLEDVAHVPQDSKSSDMGASKPLRCEDDEISTATEKVSDVVSPHWMPEKKMLELILDTLQRRDTHEIFAEPVDPEEVEDYYEIIKEPMDFGTMRAKLHEGMYTNLAQFEHDVFLISTNAMHFNSSTTIFFRQARMIHDLAKKVFHAFKTDPENFKLEFSEARRRTSRRSLKEDRFTSKSTSSKLTANLRSDGFLASSSSAMPCRPSSSNLLRTARQGLNDSDSTSFLATDYGTLSGCGSAQRNNISGSDPRCTYKPLKKSLNESDVVGSRVYNSKHLIRMEGLGFSYKDSLMLFAKNLGPTVQKVVRRKISGCFSDAPNFGTPSSTCGNLAVFANASRIGDATVTRSSEFSRPRLNECISGFWNATDKGNRFHAGGTNENNAWNQIGFSGPFLEEAPKRNKNEIPNGSSLGRCSRNVPAFQTCNHGVCSKEMPQQNDRKMATAIWEDYKGPVNAFGRFGGENMHYYPRRSGSWLHPFAKESMEEESNFNHQAGPLSPTCKHREVNMPNLCVGSNMNPLAFHQREIMGITGVGQLECTFTDQNSWSLIDGNRGSGLLDARRASSTESSEAPISSQPPPPSSRFIFDLPYLKSRLDELNYARDNKSCQREMNAGEVPSKVLEFGNKREVGTKKFYYEDHQHMPLDAKAENGYLTLQL